MLARISAAENSKYKEIPTNEDGSISVSAITRHFPNCVGLRYRCKSTGHLRGTRVINDQLHLPIGVSWKDHIFHCVYEDNTKLVNERLQQCCLIEQLQLETFDMMALGLPDNITDESFYQYFSKFGPLKLCELKKNLRKLKSKGYGFLRYVNFIDQNECIRTEHVIDGATVSLRLPTAKMDGSMSRKKLFITNITPSVSLDDILEYFSVFGKITQIFMPLVMSPYAFLTYESEDSISRVFRFGESHRVFGGYVVVEKVYTKQEMQELQCDKTVVADSQLQDNEQYPENDYDNDTFPHGAQQELQFYDQQQDQYQYQDEEQQYQNKVQQYQYDEQQYLYEEQQYQDEQHQYLYDEQQYQEEQHQYLYEDQQYQDEQHQYLYDEEQYQNEHEQYLYEEQYYQHHYGPHLWSHPQQLISSPSNPQNQAQYSLQNNSSTLNVEDFVDPYLVNNYPSPIDNYPSYPGDLFRHTSISAIPTAFTESAYENGFATDFPQDIISGVASRILEQASAPNEKDILVELLVDQLISQKTRIEEPSQPEVDVNGQNRIVKAIQLLQNPAVLDSLLRLAENVGPEGRFA